MLRCFSYLALSGLLALAAVAAAKGPAYDNPDKTDADYPYQGEYTGKVKTDDGEAAFGVQVVALGKGKFHAVGYAGGLPGDGWDGVTKIEADGELKDGEVVFKGDDKGEGRIKDNTLTVSVDGNEIGKLSKISRSSPTLGAKPPEGAVVLFDGSSADHFTNGKLIEGNLLAATNPESKQTFGDHSLHIEFRTPFMPKARGQGRGNSGVYVQARYEVQVLDSFGLDGKDNECGGIYKASVPAVNMCLPPLSWQTYDIDFTSAKYENGKKVQNAKITVRHNGVVIHDNLELKSGTPGRASEGEKPLGLFLQDHGNPVAFRNIWVVEKK